MQQPVLIFDGSVPDSFKTHNPTSSLCVNSRIYMILTGAYNVVCDDAMPCHTYINIDVPACLHVCVHACIPVNVGSLANGGDDAHYDSSL